MRRGGRQLALLLLLGAAPAVCWAQTTTSVANALPDSPQPQSSTSQSLEPLTVKGTPARLWNDQKAAWTSPLHIHAHDLVWLVPLAGATGAGIATDHHVLASVVTRDQQTNRDAENASNALVGGILAAPVLLFGAGEFTHDEHARESGLLGGQAVIEGLIVQQGMKLIFLRERPEFNNSHGLFFNHNSSVDGSFPSSHSVVAWSAAAVLAGEYPSWWKQVALYSAATGVSGMRVVGRQHFPTDVLVGSAAGWLIGHYVYKTHHRAAR